MYTYIYIYIYTYIYIYIYTYIYIHIHIYMALRSVALDEPASQTSRHRSCFCCSGEQGRWTPGPGDVRNGAPGLSQRLGLAQCGAPVDVLCVG